MNRRLHLLFFAVASHLPCHHVHAQALLEPTFYQLREDRFDLRVAVRKNLFGNLDNILSSNPTETDEQKFLFIPVESPSGAFRGYNIVCKQPNASGDSLYVTEGPSREIWARTYNGQDDQIFRIVDRLTKKRLTWFRIEPQADGAERYMLTGLDHNIQTWPGKTSFQYFHFHRPDLAPALPILQAPKAKPFAINRPPMGEGPMPPKTTPILVGEQAIPCTHVRDPYYGDNRRHQQANETPYYVLRREQYWDRTPPRGNYYHHAKNSEYTLSYEITVGTEKEDVDKVERQLSWEIGVGASGTFGKVPVNANASLSGSTTIVKEAKTRRTIAKTTSKTYTFSSGPQHFVEWRLVDKFTILRPSGGNVTDEVSSWETAYDSQVFADTAINRQVELQSLDATPDSPLTQAPSAPESSATIEIPALVYRAVWHDGMATIEVNGEVVEDTVGEDADPVLDDTDTAVEGTASGKEVVVCVKGVAPSCHRRRMRFSRCGKWRLRRRCATR